MKKGHTIPKNHADDFAGGPLYAKKRSHNPSRSQTIQRIWRHFVGVFCVQEKYCTVLIGVPKTKVRRWGLLWAKMDRIILAGALKKGQTIQKWSQISWNVSWMLIMIAWFWQGSRQKSSDCVNSCFRFWVCFGFPGNGEGGCRGAFLEQDSVSKCPPPALLNPPGLLDDLYRYEIKHAYQNKNESKFFNLLNRLGKCFMFITIQSDFFLEGGGGRS